MSDKTKKYMLKIDGQDYYLTEEEVLSLDRQCDWLIETEGLDKTLPRKRMTLSIIEIPHQPTSGFKDLVWARTRDPLNKFKVHIKDEESEGKYALCGVYLGYEIAERGLQPKDQICKNCMKDKRYRGLLVRSHERTS